MAAAVPTDTNLQAAIDRKEAELAIVSYANRSAIQLNMRQPVDSQSSGPNTVPVGATDGTNTTVTNNYQVGVTGPSSSSLTLDANGTMTSDGTNSYAWDAENRLIKISYPGSGNYSQILYDATGIKGQITETVASTLSSTKQFVNSGSRICEERDASSAVTKKFFGLGQTISGSNFFYDFDHLGSIRDMTDSSGVVQPRYDYDLYGQKTKTSGALDSDFQYAGYYMHAPSGLNLTVYRAYNPSPGRWINRDPIEEEGGISLYGYGLNRPSAVIDPSGLGGFQISSRGVANVFGVPNNFPNGCYDLVNAVTGNPLGTRPDNLSSTKCFYGPNAFSAAEAAAKNCCNGAAVWSKNSRGWTTGSAPSAGPVNPGVVAGALGDVDYVTYNPVNNFFYDLNGGGPDPLGNVYPNKPRAYATIWCSTCKNRPSKVPPARLVGH